jgi:hypothetical protein
MYLPGDDDADHKRDECLWIVTHLLVSPAESKKENIKNQRMLRTILSCEQERERKRDDHENKNDIVGHHLGNL